MSANKERQQRNDSDGARKNYDSIAFSFFFLVATVVDVVVFVVEVPFNDAPKVGDHFQRKTGPQDTNENVFIKNKTIYGAVSWKGLKHIAGANMEFFSF